MPINIVIVSLLPPLWDVVKLLINIFILLGSIFWFVLLFVHLFVLRSPRKALSARFILPH